MDTQLVTPVLARPPLELDLIADFACPWSFIGKRSLDRALGSFYGAPVPALRWHGFRGQSAPVSAPLGWSEHLAKRLPAGVSVDAAHKNFAEVGRALGIAFDFARVANLPDTREAHRLVRLAARDERQGEVADALFSAFFEEGRDIGNINVLTAIAHDRGLSQPTLIEFATPDAGREDVLAEEKRLRGMGVIATPNVVINGHVLVPGPADVATYLQALDQALFPGLGVPADKRMLH